MPALALRLLSTTIAGLCRLIDAATCLMLAAIVAIGALELAGRNFFNHSFVWAHECALLLASWVYFLGICIVYQHKGDVTVGFLVDRLGPTARRLWAAVCHLTGAVFFAIVAVHGWELLKLQAPFRTTGLGIPNPAFSAPVVVGAAILVLITLRDMAAALAGTEDGAPPAPAMHGN